MAFLGRLFGTEKAMVAMVDGVKSGLDALVHTEEEKAREAAADRSEARKMVVAWMQATQGQNLARRLIALSITTVWLLQYILSQGCIVIAMWVSEPEKWDGSAEALRTGASDMSSAVMLILAFYFAAPHMGDIVKAVTKKGIVKNG